MSRRGMLRPCFCKPGRRCTACDECGRAHFRMTRLARLERRTADPVAYADQVTSMNDARTALCLAMGVSMGHIDAASGHNLGRSA